MSTEPTTEQTLDDVVTEARAVNAELSRLIGIVEDRPVPPESVGT